MVYQIKLKEKPDDREFIVLWDEDISATAEADTWNPCHPAIFKKYKTDNRFEFKEIDAAGQKIDFSYPQNRQVRDNVAMAQLKRQFKTN